MLVERSSGNPGATSNRHDDGGIEARAQQHESDASSSAAHVEHRSRLQAEAESYWSILSALVLDEVPAGCFDMGGSGEMEEAAAVLVTTPGVFFAGFCCVF